MAIDGSNTNANIAKLVPIADGYARALEDYEAKSGSLDFVAGTTSKAITVNVKGDRTREWDEVFYVNLSGAAGAVIQAGQGTGVVRNDDDWRIAR